MTEFCCDVLGMRVTDRLGDEGAWLHVNADHHTMALVGKGYAHIHHLAFELVDWGELRVALDHLAQHGRWLAWGPVRHGLGRNLAAYVRIPEEECFVELFSDMEQLEPDHQPRDWPDDRALVQHLGHAAAALVLPLRRGGGGGGARGARGARASTTGDRRQLMAVTAGDRAPAPASSSWTGCGRAAARSG